MIYKGFVLPDDEFLANSYKFIINETHYNNLPELSKDDVVMNVGACIGSLIKRVSDQVEFVYGYEPNPVNFYWLLQNVFELPNVEVIEAAIVGGHETSKELYLSKHVGAHSIYNRKMHTEGATTIKAVNFREELDRTKPTVLVMDIEGGEYDLTEDLYNLPEGIRTIAIEIHLGRKAFVENARNLIASFEKQRFKWLLAPDPDKIGRFTGSFTNAIAVR